MKFRTNDEDVTQKALTSGTAASGEEGDIDDILRLMTRVKEKRARLKKIGEHSKTLTDKRGKRRLRRDLGPYDDDEKLGSSSDNTRSLPLSSDNATSSFLSDRVRAAMNDIMNEEEEDFVDEDLSIDSEGHKARHEYSVIRGQRRRLSILFAIAAILIVAVTIGISNSAATSTSDFTAHNNENKTGENITGESSPVWERPETWRHQCFETFQELNTTLHNYLTDATSHRSIAPLYGYPIGSWCVSKITHFDGLFSTEATYNENTRLAYEKFNQPIDGWDVSSAVSFNSMFLGAKSFNQDISRWNVSSVVDFENMFQKAGKFNQDLSSWDVHSAKNMQGMFEGAFSFQGVGIESWKFPVLESMDRMFRSAMIFNGNVSVWDVSSVTSMEELFSNAVLFNQDLHTWKLGANLSNIAGMFSQAASFNGQISGWNLEETSITSLERLFHGATAFNQPINTWNTSKIKSFQSLFAGARAFSQDLDYWDVSGVESFEGTFFEAAAFTGNITTWNMSSAKTIRQMFQGSTAFNQPISDWEFSLLDDISYAFAYCLKFNHPLRWNTSTVTKMTGVFENAVSFNGNITGWDTQQVREMDFMFQGAMAFNQSIGNWNLGQVRELGGVLVDAKSFNQDLCSWASTLKLRATTGNSMTTDTALSELFSSSHGSVPLDFRLFLNTACLEKSTPRYASGEFIGPFCQACDF